MFDFIKNLLTRNKAKIPLVYITFDYNKYKEYGELNSCTSHIHPLLRKDEIVKYKMEQLINYIRANYEMEEM